MKEATADAEHGGKQDDHLINHTVQNITWKAVDVEVVVASGTSNKILSGVDGLVPAGKRCPSGLSENPLKSLSRGIVCNHGSIWVSIAKKKTFLRYEVSTLSNNPDMSREQCCRSCLAI